MAMMGASGKKIRGRVLVLAILLAGIFLVVRFTSLGSSAARSMSVLQGAVFSRTARLRAVFSSDPDARQLAADYALIKEQNDRLILENVSLRLLERENEELREMLSFQEGFQGRLIVARVVGKPSEELARSWIIDKGTQDGVREGQAVVGSGNNLIGKVLRANRARSTLILAQDSQFRAAAMTLSSNKTSGLVSGSFGTGTTMDLIPKTERIELGDTVITSGAEELIPKGLVVGTIREITTQSNDLFQSAVLGGPEGLPALDFVGVVSWEE